MDKLSALGGWFESRDLRFLIALLLLINFLSFWPSPNEEIYLSLAKHSMDRDWIEGSFSLDEGHGSRIVFQVVWGSLAKWMSVPDLVFWTRAIFSILFAFALAKIFRVSGLGNIAALLVLQLFILADQSFFANEWILIGAESKVPAYLFILFAIPPILERRWMAGSICLLLACYFHILVGFWFGIALVVYLLFQKPPIQSLFKPGLVLVAGLLPLLFFLLRGFFCEMPANTYNINISWLFAYFRNPHHMGILKDWQYFLDEHLLGVLWTLAFFLMSLILYHKSRKGTVFNSLALFNCALSALPLLFVVVAIFDRQGVLLIYHPFRMVSLFMLFSFLLSLKFLNRGFKNRHQDSWKLVKVAALLPLLVFALLQSFQTNRLQAQGRQLGNERIQAFKAAKELSERGDQFIVLGYGAHWDPELAFERMTERARFSIFKFTPVNECRVLDWYDRVKIKERIHWDLEELFRLKDRFSLDFVFSSKSYTHPRLEKRFSNKAFFIYEILP